MESSPVISFDTWLSVNCDNRNGPRTNQMERFPNSQPCSLRKAHILPLNPAITEHHQAIRDGTVDRQAATREDFSASTVIERVPSEIIVHKRKGNQTAKMKPIVSAMNAWSWSVAISFIHTFLNNAIYEPERLTGFTFTSVVISFFAVIILSILASQFKVRRRVLRRLLLPCTAHLPDSHLRSINLGDKSMY